MIHGILAVDKPQGWTSHDVVARIRSLSGQRQAGHAGTLDPLATGVLLVVLGQATRLSSYLMESGKVYRAEAVFGVSTVTDDAEGAILRRAPVADLTIADLEVTVRRFTGSIEQVPPAYAAVRQEGERLYRLARRGVEVQPRPRRVQIHAIDIEGWQPPRLRLRVSCGPGTYIRALARDIGQAAGSAAYLHALRRTCSGGFGEADLVPLEGLTREAIMAAVQPPDRAILAWPAAVLGADQEAAVMHGRGVRLGAVLPGNVRLYGASGRLVALARGAETAEPFRVFTGGSESSARDRRPE